MMSSLFRKPSDPHGTLAPFPKYLLPIVPFRRRSRHSSTDSNSSSSSAASTETTATDPSLASNPFGRCLTPVPTPLRDDPIEPPSGKYLAGHASHIRCAKCATDLCLTSQIISKGFTGRHGRAYLIQGGGPGTAAFGNNAGHNHKTAELPNTFLSKPVPRNLVTGQHMVSDISCSICGTPLGWKYVEASDESQKYKVGKYILETKRIRVGVRWEEERWHDSNDGDDDLCDETRALSSSELKKLTDGADEELEFDSQDEDECEDLFAGVWSPALAKRRRQRKNERYRRKVGKGCVPARSSTESLA